MSTFDLTLPPQPYSRSSRRGRSALDLFAAALALTVRWAERSRQRRALAGLNEHQLRDIGITRYEAVRECEKPFWQG